MRRLDVCHDEEVLTADHVDKQLQRAINEAARAAQYLPLSEIIFVFEAGRD